MFDLNNLSILLLPVHNPVVPQEPLRAMDGIDGWAVELYFQVS